MITSTIKIDSKFSSEFQNCIQIGLAICDKHWAINQELNFVTATGKSRNGWCKILEKGKKYLIGINTGMVKRDDIIQTVVHEVLHSYPETQYDGHTGEWRKRANIINQEYSQLDIQRTNHCEKNEAMFKYSVTCTACGRTLARYVTKPTRMMQNIQHRIVACGFCRSPQLKVTKLTKEK